MSLKTFTEAYIECALWSSTGEDDEPLDKRFGASDLHGDTRRKMEADCRAFYKEWEQDWSEATWSDTQAGHDFWLSRNGHGAGFFDRAFGKLATLGLRTRDSLQKAAQAYGSFDLYIGDDGKVHGS